MTRSILSRSLVVGLLVGVPALVLGLSPAFVRPAHATTVTCGQTLDSGTFVLESDLGPCDDPTGPAALTVNGTVDTPATLDLAGFSVICQDLNGKKGVPIGIVITGDSVTVTNGKVIGCKIGVQVAGTGGHLLKNVTAENSTSSGFVIKSDGNRINAATATGGLADGFVVTGSKNLVAKSTAGSNAQAGFSVSSGHNRVKSNTATGNGGAGFGVSGSHDKVSANTADGNTGPGFALVGDRNRVGANAATGNGGAGYGVTGNRIHLKTNTASGNTGDGFTFIGSLNKVSGNTADGNSGNGFAIAITSSLNKLVGNTSNAGGKVGITVSGLSNLIKGNTAQTAATVDLEDTNPNCESNRWKANTFGTKSQDCIK
jgi:hypothetical protein